MSVWKANPDLMIRLQAAQNRPVNDIIDIMTFAGWCDTREELERHVVYYENNQPAEKVKPSKKRA